MSSKGIDKIKLCSLFTDDKPAGHDDLIKRLTTYIMPPYPREGPDCAIEEWWDEYQNHQSNITVIDGRILVKCWKPFSFRERLVRCLRLQFGNGEWVITE